MYYLISFVVCLLIAVFPFGVLVFPSLYGVDSSDPSSGAAWGFIPIITVPIGVIAFAVLVAGRVIYMAIRF